MKTGDHIDHRGTTCVVRCVLQHPDGSQSVRLSPIPQKPAPRARRFLASILSLFI